MNICSKKVENGELFYEYNFHPQSYNELSYADYSQLSDLIVEIVGKITDYKHKLEVTIKNLNTNEVQSISIG